MAGTRYVLLSPGKVQKVGDLFLKGFYYALFNVICGLVAGFIMFLCVIAHKRKKQSRGGLYFMDKTKTKHKESIKEKKSRASHRRPALSCCPVLSLSFERLSLLFKVLLQLLDRTYFEDIHSGEGYVVLNCIIVEERSKFAATHAPPVTTDPAFL